MTRALLFLPLALAPLACAEPAPMSLPITVPSPLPAAAIACPEQQNMAPEMSIVAEIGGNYRCELGEVDPDTLSASGTCPDIQIGTVRPLMLVYEQTRVGFGAPRQLAYWLTFINLCFDDEPAESVTVEFEDDDVSGKFYHLQADVDALPAGDSRPDCGDDLDEAKEWMEDLFVGDNPSQAPFSTYTLDSNTTDTRSNLVEACEDALFVP